MPDNITTSGTRMLDITKEADVWHWVKANVRLEEFHKPPSDLTAYRRYELDLVKNWSRSGQPEQHKIHFVWIALFINNHVSCSISVLIVSILASHSGSQCDKITSRSCHGLHHITITSTQMPWKGHQLAKWSAERDIARTGTSSAPTLKPQNICIAFEGLL